ncbi:Hypothetical predicted protein, partial [Olea europaea subsp. europaea]
MRWSQSIGSVEMVVMCGCGGGSSGGDMGDVVVVIGSGGLWFEQRCWIVSQCSQSVVRFTRRCNSSPGVVLSGAINVEVEVE